MNDRVHKSAYFSRYTHVPAELFDGRCKLNNTEKIIYMVYLSFSDNVSGQSWPSNRTVANMAQVSIATLKRTKTQLLALGYISIEPRFNAVGRQTSNLVTIRHPLETSDFGEESGEGLTHEPLPRLMGEPPRTIPIHKEEEETSVRIEQVADDLNIPQPLARKIIKMAGNDLDTLLSEIKNASVPVKDRTAYFLKVTGNPEEWEIFISNVRSNFLTRPRKQKKRTFPQRAFDKPEADSGYEVYLGHLTSGTCGGHLE